MLFPLILSGMKVVVSAKDQNGTSRYYRAQILDVIQRTGKILAFCVDYGNTVTVPWKSVHKLQLQFAYLDCQVYISFVCSLEVST